MYSLANLSSVSSSDPLLLVGTSVVSEVGWLPHILEATSHKEPPISTKMVSSEYLNSSQVKPKLALLARFNSNIKEVFGSSATEIKNFCSKLFKIRSDSYFLSHNGISLTEDTLCSITNGSLLTVTLQTQGRK